MILIQNVSAQCIPNLVAVRTLRPGRVIWICTREFEHVLDHLQPIVSQTCRSQERWLVDARDAEGMHAALGQYFARLPTEEQVVYHLTGGTKSMSLQGLYNLGTFRREYGARVLGVVMDPREQKFDVVYPTPRNGAFPCARLALEEILAVHGNRMDPGRPMRTTAFCAERRQAIERIRLLAPAVRHEMQGRKWRKLHRDGARIHEIVLQTAKGAACSSIGKATREAMRIAATELEIAESLEISGAKVRYRPRRGALVQYITGDWLEDWVAAVLHRLDWDGDAGASVHVRIGRGEEKTPDEQELDFLGARNNHLVYFSCKHTGELTQPQLFEVDAMRDEVGGRDFHVAGIVHTGAISPTMRRKARRMQLHVVEALGGNAEAELLKIAGA